MGATNTTTYYNLSQFIGTDKPAWLQDYNGDMLKIDTAINNAKIAADSAANAASAAQNDATTALGDITTINGQIGTINTTLGTAVGNINTINSLIGNGTPTTTDQTIIGAINELHSDIITLENGVGSASHAIKAMGIQIGVSADGVKTIGDMYEELYAAIVTKLATYDTDDIIEVVELIDSGEGVYVPAGVQGVQFKASSSYTGTTFTKISTDPTNFSVTYENVAASASSEKLSTVKASGVTSYVDKTSNVPASGRVFIALINVYKPI